LDVFGESGGGAIDTDLDFSVEGQALGFLQFIEDSSSDIFDQALELDGLTFLAEVSAALVVRVGRKEGAIGGEDFKREKAQEVDDLYQDLSDLGIELCSQAIFEMSEIGFTGNVRTRDPGIESIMFPHFFIPDSREEGFQVRELLQVSEQFEEKETDGIVGIASHGRVG